VFGGVWRYFFVSFSGRILDGWRCLRKNRSRHEKGGIIAHYCAIPPSQPPFIAYNIAQYIFPTPPFIAINNKILAISCKGQIAVVVGVSVGVVGFSEQAVVVVEGVGLAGQVELLSYNMNGDAALFTDGLELEY